MNDRQNLPATTSHAILTLDLGTHTGWAMLQIDGSITSGTQIFKPQRFEGGGMRYLRFKRWLTELKACTVPLSTPPSNTAMASQSLQTGLEAIYFEEVRRHASTDAAHAYGGFLATLTAWSEHHQIPYQGIPVSTIKKHATGKGNASKEDMIAAMRAKGHHPEDDNEADALALLHWALNQGAGAA